MNKWKKIGYVSVEAVITAALILAVGFFALLNLSGTGSQLVQNGLAKLDNLGIFDSNSGPIYDDNGYPEDSNVNPGDINPVSDFTFELNLDGDGYILVSYNNKTDFDVVIPNEYEGLPVMAIGESAFDTDFTSTPLTSIVMPNTIELIGNYAFYNNQLQEVIIPGSVTEVSEGAFYMGVLNHVTFLGNLPAVLGIDIFTDNTNLKTRTVLVPDNQVNAYKAVAVAQLGVPVNAIYGKNQPIEPDTVNAEEDFEFIWDDVLNGWMIVAYYNEGDSDVIIPSQLNDGLPVVSINHGAFNGNNLTSVVLPSSLKTIKSYAFANNQLTSIAIPNTVTDLEEGAFIHNNLTSIAFSSSLNALPLDAFAWNKLVEINIPGNIKTIEQYAFRNNLLETVTLSEGVETIGGFAFTTNNITVLNMPNSLSTIGQFAFYENNLINVSIPNGVTSIHDGAFNTNQLTSVAFGAGLLSIGDVAFEKNNFSGQLTLPDSLISIGTAAFVESGYTSVVFGTGMRELGDGAFADSQLSSITFKSSLDVTGYNAFYGCNNLTNGSVRVPNVLVYEYELNSDSLGFSSSYIVGY